jgi:hypothetical protein
LHPQGVIFSIFLDKQDWYMHSLEHIILMIICITDLQNHVKNLVETIQFNVLQTEYNLINPSTTVQLDIIIQELKHKFVEWQKENKERESHHPCSFIRSPIDSSTTHHRKKP